MNCKTLLLLFTIAGFASCSTPYRSSQTPDDVYFSPLRPVNHDDNKEKRDNTYTVENRTTDNNNPYDRPVYNGRDYDPDYRYGSRRYNRRYRNNPVYTNPKTNPTTTTAGTTPRKVNTKAYTPEPKILANTDTVDPKTGATIPGTSSKTPTRKFETKSSNKPNNNGVSGFIRNFFNTDNSSSASGTIKSNNNTYTTPPNNNNSSSSSSGSSGSSGGSGSAPVRTFGK